MEYSAFYGGPYGEDLQALNPTAVYVRRLAPQYALAQSVDRAILEEYIRQAQCFYSETVFGDKYVDIVGFRALHILWDNDTAGGAGKAKGVVVSEKLEEAERKYAAPSSGSSGGSTNLMASIFGRRAQAIVDTTVLLPGIIAWKACKAS